MVPAESMRKALALAKIRGDASLAALELGVNTPVPADLIPIPALAKRLGTDRFRIHFLITRHKVKRYHFSRQLVCVSLSEMIEKYQQHRVTPSPFRREMLYSTGQKSRATPPKRTT